MVLRLPLTRRVGHITLTRQRTKNAGNIESECCISEANILEIIASAAATFQMQLRSGTAGKVAGFSCCVDLLSMSQFDARKTS